MSEPKPPTDGPETNPYDPPTGQIRRSGAGRLLMNLLGGVVVGVSAVIAFFATCFPVAMVTGRTINSLEAMFVISIGAGLVVSGFAAHWSRKFMKSLRKDRPEDR